MKSIQIISLLAENLKTDLWQYETTDGKSLHKCVDWLLPYLKKEQKWTHQQIKKTTYEYTVPILKMAAKAYSNPVYDSLAKDIDGETYQLAYYQLVF